MPAMRTPALERRLQEVIAQYNTFDRGHDVSHVIAVRDRAIALAEKYDKTLVLLAEIAAVYHDVGLMTGRTNHEFASRDYVISDPVLQAELSDDDLLSVASAVLHHRASSGQPCNLLDKIVADADRTPISSGHALWRAYDYGVRAYAWLSHEQQLLRAAAFLLAKYGPGGYGRKTFFPETEQAITDAMAPIIAAYTAGDFDALDALLQQATTATPAEVKPNRVPNVGVAAGIAVGGAFLGALAMICHGYAVQYGSPLAETLSVVTSSVAGLFVGYGVYTYLRHVFVSDSRLRRTQA